MILPLIRLFATAFCGALCLTHALAQHGPAPQQGAAGAPAPTVTNVYAPYEDLIGDWEVGPPGEPPTIMMHFKWAGGKRGYILFNTSLLRNGVEETHFEGILVWNAQKQNLDMLVSLDPENGQTQESGSVYVTADGTIVRQIFAVGPHSVRSVGGRPAPGAAMFRQTFKKTGPAEMKTTVMRDTLNGWVPTFPGSDNLVMRKRAAHAANAADPHGAAAGKSEAQSHGH